MAHRPFACLFPGQGSQSVGMGRDLYEHFPLAQEVFDQADSLLGEKLSNLCFYGPREILDRTECTQPAMLTCSVAGFRVLEAAGCQPAAVAGHSLGEFTALVAAGGMAFQDALPLVRKRGRYMQQAVPEGQGMMAAVVGLSREAVEAACRETSPIGVVVPANYNCPGQIVIAGETQAVQEATQRMKAAGAKRVIPLPVSVPSHTPLMAPAAQRLAEDLAPIPIHSLSVPLVNNADAQPLTDPEAIRDSLVRQLPSPLRWEETMHRLLSNGIRSFVEVGPGKVLAGLMKRIDATAAVYSVQDPASLEDTTHRLVG